MVSIDQYRRCAEYGDAQQNEMRAHGVEKNAGSTRASGG
jgi:hypothetical protein